MSTIGIDCECILDGTGYFVKPGTYRMKQPRIRKATVRADGGESYVDLGPGKRVWSMVMLCLNDLLKYDGTATGMTGEQYRAALRTSYSNSVGTTLQYTDPLNGTPLLSTSIATRKSSMTCMYNRCHSRLATLRDCLTRLQ